MNHLRGLALAAIVSSTVAVPPANAAIDASRVALVDQTGRTFTIASLRGAPVIVTFVDTHCRDACPLVNAQFERAATEIARAHRRTKLLTLTLDPERDRLAEMHKVAVDFGADPRHWLLASGSVRNVHAVMDALGVIVRRGPDGYQDVHTTFIYVLDSKGRLARTMLAAADSNDQLVAIARDEARL
jgi:protein SCO1/2